MEYVLSNEFIQATFSSLGGELRSVKNVKTGREYLWQGNPEFWTGHSPNLFPIVGRVHDGKYTCKGNEYSIKSPHGFVRISELDLFEMTDNKIVFNIKSSEDTLKVYPYEFDYYVSFVLEGAKLTVSFKVVNTGNETMLFSVGAHPGFNVPINEGEKFENYSLVFDNDCFPSEVICDNCYVTGETRPFPIKNNREIPLRHNLFDNDAIILTDLDSRVLTLKTTESDSYVKVDFTDFGYLGIWHKPMVEAPYVCIEPWNGLPSLCGDKDELSEKPAIISLDAGKEYSVSYSIEIR